MKKTISLVLVLALCLATEVANADFTFGTPKNLGPIVNSSALENAPNISADGLRLYFASNQPGSQGGSDIWVTSRATEDDPWGSPVNLGPAVNSSAGDGNSCMWPDGLTLYFQSNRPEGYGRSDIWVTTRATEDKPWGSPVNLGPTVNSPDRDAGPSILLDGLSLYFNSDRPGGFGSSDLWLSTRMTTADPWGEPVNLGSTINSPDNDFHLGVSADGLSIFFTSSRPGGLGLDDIWVSTWSTIDAAWDLPVNLGLVVNSPARDRQPSISTDGSTLYFGSDRSGGEGDYDIWQVLIIPIVDFNGDGVVDSTDMCEMVDHWGTDEQLYDIGPMPWGDGIVDVQDLIVLAEHLFEGIPPVEPEEVNVDEKDDDSQVELEQGQILVVTLESNPTTGYRWEQIEAQESILQQMGEAEFKPSETGETPLVGAGGWEIFRFKAISAGQMTLQLVYHRPWEEGVEPLNTFSLQVVVR